MLLPICLFILFALLFRLRPVHNLTVQNDQDDLKVLVLEQISLIFEAYWKKEAENLFQLLCLGTYMDQFLKDHANDGMGVAVQEAEYFEEENLHGIRALVIVSDESVDGNKNYVVQVEMVPDEESPTGYILSHWVVRAITCG